MTTSTDRTREQRLRRMAARQGLKLVKSRLRDPYALGYGSYTLTTYQGAHVAGPHPGLMEDAQKPGWTLDDIERYLKGER